MITSRTLVAMTVVLLGLAIATPAEAACTNSGTPVVTTDRSNYGPFETVTISGCGLGYRELLSILVTAPNGDILSGSGTGLAGPDYASTDESGAFALSYRLSGARPGAGNYSGQNGQYHVAVRNSAGAVLATTQFSRSPQKYFTCAVTAGGGVRCWGMNDYGQLGNGSYAGSSTPVDVSGLLSGVVQISVGLNHTCAVTESGSAKCWGDGSEGQLGNGNFTKVTTPVDVSGLSNGVVQISAGTWHTCAVTVTGGAKCWGYGLNGELGDGSLTRASTPVDVYGLTSGVVRISAGGSHTCALLTSGGVKCWGYGGDGALGNGVYTSSSTPVDVIGLGASIAQISAGYTHTCAVTVTGGAQCWGNNSSDQLGTGFGSTNTPAQVFGLTSGVAQISTNFFNTCAVTTNGGAKCWGNNGYGQLGNGSYTSSKTPVDVSGLSDGVAQIVAGDPHTCALTTAGGIKCWGYGSYGALGNGPMRQSIRPIDVRGLTSGAALLPEISGNLPPTVSSGGPYKGIPDSAIALSSASASDRNPADRLTYQWTVNSPLCIFSDTHALNPNLTCSDKGVFLVSLEVNDHFNPPVRSDDASVTVESGQAASPVTSVDSLQISSTDPDFFWLPPTVPLIPILTGPFDATLLSTLAVEICQLDSAGACLSGAPIARFTSTSSPFFSRIRLDQAHEYYTVDWLTGTNAVSADLFYRIRAFKGATELGTLDVDIVSNPAQLPLVDTQRYVGVVRGQSFTIRFRMQHPTARTRVKINEVESNLGVPGDWAELFNTATVPLSLAGYIVKDNDDTHIYTLPADATIPALGYYVVEESALGFGLGAADSVRFFTPGSAVLVDSVDWTAHAATTYGRCPNGTGAFQTNTTVTKGAANDCSVVIRINEVESSGGVPGDWTELFNPGPGPANLTGYIFKDNDDTHSYSIPAGTIVPAGGYYLLEEAAFGFGLGGADSVRLFQPGGTTLADSYTWTVAATTTYGRCPNGTGAFTTTVSVTKGAANDCPVPVLTVKINEVESSGGVPGDWAELFNTGTSAADISGFVFKDNDDTHNYVIPAGTIVPAGGYYLLEEAAFGFGLGGADSVRLFQPDGATLADSYTWTIAATTTYGRCPNGTGAFTTTLSVTKGTANDCGNPVKINEVESSGGVPGDWVELYNPSSSPVDISGLVFKDNDDTHNYTIPGGTTIAAGAYYLLEEAAFGFGLGGADSARLFQSDGTTVIDSYTWTVAATTTYGRCPNGTGAFTTTTSVTKGSANACPGEITFLAWPGDADVQTIDGLNVFGGNLSGLVYEGTGEAAPGVLWGARNGPGSLFRLVWNGTIFTPDTANSWGSGKLLLYPGGTGSPDSEGVTFADVGSVGGLYVSTERDNNASGISRNSILRFDPAAAGTTLTATHEWNLTADLPVVGANLGMEAITWIPDTFLLSRNFFDESKSHTYVPGEYPNHGNGLFFIGLEANGVIYAYALDHVGGGFTRIATITTGLAGVMDLQFDRELNDLWAVCDDGCQGRSAVLRIDAVTGKFVVARLFERPTAMPNLNNEGFAFAALTECVSNRRPAFWADDSETGGHAIRRGTLTCTPF